MTATCDGARARPVHPSAPRSRGRRGPVLAAAVLVAALPAAFVPPAGAATTVAATATAVRAGAPGAAGIGDRLFPQLGNGGYDVRRYDLTLRYPAKNPAQDINGDVTIIATATQDLSRFDLDFAGVSLKSVRVNGRAAAFSRRAEELVVTPRATLRKGHRFTVTVRGFVARPQRPDPTASTILPFVYTRDGSVVSAQPDGAHTIFPSNDHPRDKAPYVIRLDVPAGWTGVANGVPVAHRTAKGRSVTTYLQRQPMASELLQAAVGDFTVIRRPAAYGVPVRDVVPRRLAAELSPRLAIERSQLGWMQARVGRYPFDLYGSLVIDAQLGFALETQTLSLYDMVLLGPTLPVGVRNAVMLHELSHQWFGDSVSPWSWSDVWQNEGHATWYEVTYAAQYGWLDDETGFTDLESMFKAIYALGDQWRDRWGPVARPKSATIVWDLFNPNVYQGGALALYALRQKIGPAAFARLERAWVAQYRNRSGSTDDFIRLASRVAHRDLRTFLLAWLYGTRTPPMPGHPDWTVTPVPSSARSSAAALAALTSGPATAHFVQLVRHLAAAD
jgi:aminopeptidase N